MIFIILGLILGMEAAISLEIGFALDEPLMKWLGFIAILIGLINFGVSVYCSVNGVSV